MRAEVDFTNEQIQALEALAAQGHISVSDVVRRAVDDWVKVQAVSSDEGRRRRAITAAGRFSSGLHDVAVSHDEYLAESYRR